MYRALNYLNGMGLSRSAAVINAEGFQVQIMAVLLGIFHQRLSLL